MSAKRTPAIIDIEASGFGVESYPIEIGVANYNGERYCALIKPEPDWLHWCDEAETIHGISRELIEANGKPARLVCEELNQFLQNANAYSDAWTYDQTWLNRLYYAGRVERSFYLSPLENITSDEQFSIWDKTKQSLEQSLKIRRHRASGDAYLIQQTFLETAKILRDTLSTVGSVF